MHVSAVALKRLQLDAVWWLVSPQNPLKPARGMASMDERLASARAVARHPRIVVTDVEAQLGTVYSAETLAALRRRFPAARFVWLMGSDNLLQIPRWKHWRSIFQSVPVAVVARPGSALRARSGQAVQTFGSALKDADRRFADLPPPALAIIETRRHPQSATQLRAARGSAA